MRAALALLVVVGAIGADAAAVAGNAGRAAAEKVAPTGVGRVMLGETYAALRAQHLVGRIGQGCQLVGPNARSAALSAPLKGNVDFTMNLPRRVAHISVQGGARARGVGIGARIANIKAAYPKAKVDHATDHMFGVTIVRVPRNGGGKLEFAVRTTTHKVVLIGIPFISFCE